MTEYGTKVKAAFLEKCKQNGTYDKVYVDFEDGTCLLQETVQTIEDVAAWYLETYGEFAYNAMCEQVEFCCNNWNAFAWNFENGKHFTYLELKAVLEKCL